MRVDVQVCLSMTQEGQEKKCARCTHLMRANKIIARDNKTSTGKKTYKSCRRMSDIVSRTIYGPIILPPRSVLPRHRPAKVQKKCFTDQTHIQQWFPYYIKVTVLHQWTFSTALWNCNFHSRRLQALAMTPQNTKSLRSNWFAPKITKSSTTTVAQSHVI